MEVLHVLVFFVCHGACLCVFVEMYVSVFVCSSWHGLCACCVWFAGFVVKC